MWNSFSGKLELKFSINNLKEKELSISFTSTEENIASPVS
jgi:hypothetical protein